MIPKPTWSVVATIKDTVFAVKEFVAHYKAIGATEIFIYFDDPDDPAYDVVKDIPGVFATLCTQDHWGGPPRRRIEPRQKFNANHAYQLMTSDWAIHLDADELIWTAGDIADALASLPQEQIVSRVPPAEQFVARRSDGVSIFRRPLPANRRGNRIGYKVWGDIYPLLERGLFGHSMGKYFVRTGSDVRLSIHAPNGPDGKLDGPVLPGADLLHLHGGDADKWVKALQFRMEAGAYRPEFHDVRKRAGRVNGMGRHAFLSKLAEAEGEAGLRAFHARVAVFGPNKRPLGRAGAILKVRLWLPQKVAAYFGDCDEVATKSFAINHELSRMEAEVEYRGNRMIVHPDDNYTETCLASGRPYEKAEHDAIEDLVRNQRVIFWDVGANAGIYSLLVARHAAADSRILAFEPSPEMARRFRRNVAINEIENVELHQIALGEMSGTARMSMGDSFGQATMRDIGGMSQEVPVRLLSSFVDPDLHRVLKVLKIDIEGGEPECLCPFFRGAPEPDWPDYILYEHEHIEEWSIPPKEVFPEGAYVVENEFENNTLLRRKSRATR